MGLFQDVIIGVPVGIIYSLFMSKVSDVLYSDVPYKEKFQRKMVTLFIAGILGIVLARTIFTNSYFKNKSIRIGLIFGSIILFVYSLFTNWDKLDDGTKLLIIGIIFGLVVWYSYHFEDNVEKIKKRKKNKKKGDNNESENLTDESINELIKSQK